MTRWILTLVCAFGAGSAVVAHAQGQAPAGGAKPAAGTYSGGLPATYLPLTDVQKFLQALPKDVITDAAIRTVDVGGYRVGVYGVFRPKTEPGDAIAHEVRTTEIYYIVKGGGTLVTGGTITGIKPPPAGRNAGPRGDKIEGGVVRHVTVGDIIIIPGRTPHWWSSLDSDINYLIYRPDPDSRLTLK